MSIIQIILIAIFVYLGSIGSIVGNTIGWYTLGRPLVAALVVGVILGDIQTAMAVGIPLQIMYMGNVTPGGAVAWDLSYATYIGVAAAIVFGQGMDATGAIGLAVVFAGILKPAAEPGCRKICRSRGYPQNDRSERLHGSGNRFLMPLCSGSARSDVDDGRFRSG